MSSAMSNATNTQKSNLNVLDTSSSRIKYSFLTINQYSSAYIHEHCQYNPVYHRVHVRSKIVYDENENVYSFKVDGLTSNFLFNVVLLNKTWIKLNSMKKNFNNAIPLTLYYPLVKCHRKDTIKYLIKCTFRLLFFFLLHWLFLETYWNNDTCVYNPSTYCVTTRFMTKNWVLK